MRGQRIAINLKTLITLYIYAVLINEYIHSG